MKKLRDPSVTIHLNHPIGPCTRIRVHKGGCAEKNEDAQCAIDEK